MRFRRYARCGSPGGTGQVEPCVSQPHTFVPLSWQECDPWSLRRCRIVIDLPQVWFESYARWVARSQHAAGGTVCISTTHFYTFVLVRM